MERKPELSAYFLIFTKKNWRKTYFLRIFVISVKILNLVEVKVSQSSMPQGRGHPCSTYAKFSEKLTFLTP